MNKKLIFGGIMMFLLVGLSLLVQSQDVVSDDQFKQEFLYRINKVRAAGCNCGRKRMPPAPPITWNNVLESAAIGHAKDMNARNYFSHTSKDGRSIEDRILNAGYNYKGYQSFAIGENIAYGQQSIAEVSNGWFKSEGHCRNLMNPDFKEVGVARSGLYWVQDFGGRVPFTAAQQQMIKNGAKLIFKKEKAGHE